MRDSISPAYFQKRAAFGDEILFDDDGNPINIQGDIIDPLEEGQEQEEDGKPVTFEDL